MPPLPSCVKMSMTGSSSILSSDAFIDNNNNFQQLKRGNFISHRIFSAAKGNTIVDPHLLTSPVWISLASSRFCIFDDGGVYSFAMSGANGLPGTGLEASGMDGIPLGQHRQNPSWCQGVFGRGVWTQETTATPAL